MGNYKLTAAAEYIAEAIDRLTSLTVTLDQSGADPLITVGAVAATTNVGFQVGLFDQRGGVDAGWDPLPGSGFGSSQQPVYTGTVAKIAYELGAAPKAYFVELWEIAQVAEELARRGATVEIWQIANGQAPTVANIAAQGTLKSTYNANAYYPIQGRV
jgi:hypothetical protein